MFKLIEPHNPNFEKVKIQRNGRDFCIEIHVTDHCNLSCKGCRHFSPIADEWFIDVDDFEKQLVSLHTQVGSSRIYYISLIGGEPLLHPHIAELSAIVHRIFPNSINNITTNGLLIKTLTHEQLDIMRKSNVVLVVSCYDVRIDYEDLYNYLTSKNITCSFVNRKRFDARLLDKSKPYNCDESYSKCDSGGIFLQLRDGKLYPCSAIAYIDFLNKKYKTKFEVTDKDYLNVSDLTEDNVALGKFRSCSIPFCSYCVGEKTPFDWEILKEHTQDEWVSADKKE